MSAIPTLYDFVVSPHFLGLPVSLGQGTVIKALDGLPLRSDEREIWQQCTGRAAYPEGHRFEEVTVIAGARSGKDSRIAAPVVLHEALFGGHEAHLGAGEVGTIPLVAQDKQGTRTAFGYVSEYLRRLRAQAPAIDRMVTHEFTSEIRFANRLTVQCFACTAKSMRGWSIPAAAMDELTVLRHMLRLARKWGYLDRVPDIELPQRPEWRQRYLEENEIARLLEACRKSRNPYLAAIVTIALNTGMRKAEILELSWERVDLSTGRITLYRTKSGKPRGVPMNRAVYAALVALEPSAEQRTGLIFTRSTERRWGQIRTAFATVLKRAEISAFRFHDLRHTAASHMVMRGASLKDVQEILGHADMKMTMRYSHLSPAHLRATVDRLDGLTPAPLDGVAQHKDQHKVLESGVGAA